MSSLLSIALPPSFSVVFPPNDDDDDGDVDITNRDNIDKAGLPTAVCRIK
jgi:hypothetical protein